MSMPCTCTDRLVLELTSVCPGTKEALVRKTERNFPSETAPTRPLIMSSNFLLTCTCINFGSADEPVADHASRHHVPCFSTLHWFENHLFTFLHGLLATKHVGLEDCSFSYFFVREAVTRTGYLQLGSFCGASLQLRLSFSLAD